MNTDTLLEALERTLAEMDIAHDIARSTALDAVRHTTRYNDAETALDLDEAAYYSANATTLGSNKETREATLKVQFAERRRELAELRTLKLTTQTMADIERDHYNHLREVARLRTVTIALASGLTAGVDVSARAGD